MAWFVALIVKSLLIAGGTLLLLRLMRNRSAADRSWIAHLGLAALVLLPIATFALPALEVQTSLLADDKVAAAPVAPVATDAPEVALPADSFRADTEVVVPAAIDWQRWGLWSYVVPAALLFLLTLIAVGRLVALKSRAQVLVDAHWLSALARAQRRMGFKNGTALLTSDELRSPVSWGLMRPVIVLNQDAADAHEEAEAIIAHELAHVARLDWAKLLLARVAVALFWFNPFVWVLAREAHQLREETADDAVLGSEIEDTDYARLLVGIARHECNGMLLGAHGVAPSRNSLSRRVRRVLDRALTRAPGGWRWTSAAAFFAAGMAVPVAALNLVPTTPVAPAVAGPTSVGGKVAAPALAALPTEAIAAIAPTTTLTSAASVAHPHPDAAKDRDEDYDVDFDVDVDIDEDMEQVGRDVRAAAAEVRASVADARASAHAGAKAAARVRIGRRELDDAISAKVIGLTPEYMRDMRAASPELRGASMEELKSMRIHGVKPEFVHELAQAGHRGLSASQLTSAAIKGVNATYVRDMASVGYGKASLKDLSEMRMFGVTADYVRQFQKAGYRDLSTKQLVKMRTFGVQPRDLAKKDTDNP